MPRAVQIVCSDIDTRVLETAARGIYPIDARGIGPERQRRHFLRGTGANAGSMRVLENLGFCDDGVVIELPDYDTPSRYFINDP